MTRTSRVPKSRILLLLAGSGLAITLAGCKVDNRPLLGRDNPQFADAGLVQPGLPGSPSYGSQPYGAQAYPASYLPPERAYPYAERAYRYDRAFYDTPPDYGFAYQGEEPWAWQAADDSLMFAEPYGADYRFYYYQSGADHPYFVRDDRYGYAYGDNGALVALFDAAGALIGGNDYGRYAPQAQQYWSRGRDLHSSYGRGQRMPVDPGVWSQRAPRIIRAEQPWMAAPERQPQWRDWRASAGAQALQGYDVRRANRGMPTDQFSQYNGSNREAGRQGYGDNGRHLGWSRGMPAGEAAQNNWPNRPFEAQGHGDNGRHLGWSQGQAFARTAERHGQDASFRGPQPQMTPPSPQQVEGRGGGGGGEHGRRGWNDGQGHGEQQQQHQQQQAQNGGGQGDGHWGGDHGQHGQPQGQAQPQNGGQGHGGGGHPNGGEQKQDGGDHGHHHGG